MERRKRRTMAGFTAMRATPTGRTAWMRTFMGAFICTLGVLAYTVAAGATEIRAFEVTRDGEMYRLHSDIALQADAERVRAVLARYERIPQLDPDITEVTMLGANTDGSVRMRLAGSQCVLIFCVRYRWTQDVRTLPSGDIFAEIVPDGGDIGAGWVRYRTVREGTRTRLIVDADIDASGVPLPAALAESWMQARLQDEALETARLVERAARTTPVISRASTPQSRRL